MALYKERMRDRPNTRELNNQRMVLIDFWNRHTKKLKKLWANPYGKKKTGLVVNGSDEFK